MKTVDICQAGLACAALACAPVIVHAQDADKTQQDDAIPVVVVSVERVTQSLQSYEGTAATVSQAELDSLGATNFVDLPAIMPGVEITNYEDNTELYVRGIGSNANTELGDPAIAPHLDDVYVPRPRGLGVAFFDIDRVEVNVGPQGTIRGRNALGGTINIVSKKPKLNEFQGYAQYAVGDYSAREFRGAVNVPLTGISAARFSVYSSKHDPFVRNAGPLRELDGWESGDDVGGRAHFLVEPSERLSVLLTGDYLRSRGTGSRGIDFFNASSEGLTFNGIDDPRKVNMVGFTPTQDTRHWGGALNATYRTDVVDVQLIAGYRDLHYQSDHSTSGRNFAFAGDEREVISRSNLANPNDPVASRLFLQERYYGNYSALVWDTTSKSRTQELRFTSPADSGALTWALGLYHFKEDQAVFLGIPQDFNTNLPYLEFNQGSTTGESKSGYLDLTWAATERLRITGGARYSKETKERTGFNFIAGLDTNGVAVRTGTPGFRMTGLGRTLTNPDANGDGVPNTLADIVALYRAGIASYGINDTLSTFLSGGCVQASAFEGTCANYPGLGIAFGGATLQQGSNSDHYIDWRFRVGFDLTDRNLLYALVATGNKAPSFNDTVDLDPAHPGTKLFTPPVGPEKSTLFEVGSKNTMDFAGRPLVLNASLYYTKYTDQVFSSLVGIQLLDNDKSNDAGCLDADPTTPCATVTLNQNVGKSRNMGMQLDAAYNLPAGFHLAGTLLWQDSEYKHGSIVTDGRRGSPVAGSTLQVDLGGNELARSPPLTLNLRVSQDIPVSTGTVDWIVSATHKSRQFLSAFNGGPGDDGAKQVTAVDARGVATAYGADLLRLYDKVDAYTHLDLGVGYTHDKNNLRVEAYVNNVTDEAHATQAVIDTTTQEFVFNPPRTYGLRVQVNF